MHAVTTDHHHHELPSRGSALTGVAISATLHCLTGCAIGEVLGMLIGTALGFSALGTVALAVGLAFVFGYGLTSLPLLRSGMTVAAVVPIALASDTLSIATMEVVDNAIMLVIPGAMAAGVGGLLFWGSLSFSLVVAGAVAVPVNRWLIGRGKGHAVVHATGIHGGPSPRAVAIAAAVAFAFGSSVLIAEVLGGRDAVEPNRDEWRIVSGYRSLFDTRARLRAVAFAQAPRHPAHAGSAARLRSRQVVRTPYSGSPRSGARTFSAVGSEYAR